MRAVSVTMMALALAAPALATDHPQEARKLSLRDRPGSSSLSWTSKLPAPTLPASSPTVVGARLRVAAGGGESAWVDLPASGWSAYQSGTRFKYVFRNKRAPIGPSTVKLAVLDDQRVVRITAKSSGITLDEAAQGTVAVELFIGDDVYCSECTAPSRDQPGNYKARLCPAPASCPAGFCGNGVIDESSEQCDGAALGTCANVPIQLAVGCQSPGSTSECTCCSHDLCIGGITTIVPCCGPAQCQDTTGIGQVRGGACIPPTCDDDADCNGYRCVDGTCCGNAGSFCGVAGCCPDSGTTCTYNPGVFATLCCKGSGGTCTDYIQCCSLSCTNGACD